jgi:hypothetical protein
MLCIGLAEAQDIPDGGLGHPLGTYLTIEGVRAPQQYMTDTVNTLLVDTVNGKKLDTPGRIWVENADSLPKDTRCILRGYETGSMIGTPPAVIEAAKEEGKDFTPEQFGWRFQRGFIVLSVVEPKDLKKK